jgi:hypothetical protein
VTGTNGFEVVRTTTLVSGSNRHRSEESISLVEERHEEEADRAKHPGSFHRGSDRSDVVDSAREAAQQVSLQPITDDWLPPPLIVVVPPTGPPPLPEGMAVMYAIVERDCMRGMIGFRFQQNP